MWKWFRWVLLNIIIFLTLVFLYFFQPWVYLPHDRLQMALPFSQSEDMSVSLIPMGETIEHNSSNDNPDGHPGLDFGFKRETNILAVSDGLITGISKGKEGYRVEERTWFYRIEYTELNSVVSNLHLFFRVKEGQIIGNVGTSEDISQKFEKGAKSRQMHWDFASSSMAIDRLCPVNYFDAESKARIENIWARIPSSDLFKHQGYTEICNGIFKGKEE